MTAYQYNGPKVTEFLAREKNKLVIELMKSCSLKLVIWILRAGCDFYLPSMPYDNIVYSKWMVRTHDLITDNKIYLLKVEI